MKKPTYFVFFLMAREIACTTSDSSSSSPKIRLPGHAYRFDGDDSDASWWGAGREFDLFETKTRLDSETIDSWQDDKSHALGASSSLPSSGSPSNRKSGYYSATPNTQQQPPPLTPTAQHTYSSTSASFKRSQPAQQQRRQYYHYQQRHRNSFFQPLADWWSSNISPNIKSWPKIQCRMEPTTTLKIRKTFRPLKTIVRLGADYNTQLGVWQFKSSWEDAIIGGKLTLAGRELQLTKSWQLSVGAMEDLVTRLRFRAAVDLQTYKAYARVGFRTERLSPINVMEGFTVMKQLPLDGNKGHVKLEVKANFALPEPEIEYSTESQRSLIGMGDVEVNIEELNLVLDY